MSFFGRRRKKTTRWRHADSVFVLPVPKKPMLGLHGVTNESGHFQENEHESGMRPCTCWCKIFEAGADGERHFCHETLLRYVQKASGDRQWEIDTHEFDDMMATKKFAPGPEGFSIKSTGERQGWDLSSCLMRVNVCLRVSLFPHTLLRAGPSSSPSFPMLTTMVLL